MSADQLDEMINEAKANDSEIEKKEAEQQSTESTTPTTVEINGKKGKVGQFFIPDEDPASMERIDYSPASSNYASPNSTNFKDMALKAINNLQTPKATKQPVKRQRVNPFADIVTSDESFQKIEDEMKRKEAEEKEKKKKKSRKRRLKRRKR